MKKTIIKILFVTITLTSALLLAGCGDTSSENVSSSIIPKDSRAAVSVIVGTHSNQNVISVNSSEILDAVNACTYTYGAIDAVKVDGKPHEFIKATIDPPSTTGLSDRKLKEIADKQTKALLDIFEADGSAESPEVDTLKAISIGSNFLSSQNGDKYMVILDSGLSTDGYLNFAENDLFNTETSDIIHALKNAHAIPNLSDVTVFWFYNGETASPQEELSESQKAKLKEIWIAVLKEAGVNEINIRTENPTNQPYEGLPSVTTIKTADRSINVHPLSRIVLDESKVEFVGDSSKFVDPESAKCEIRKVADILLNNPNNRVYVAGCTASGSDDYCNRLSGSRASAVADVLMSYGVPSSQIVTVALGCHAPWHKDDIDDDGNLIESIAHANRCVAIVDQDDEEYGFIIKDIISKS